MLTSIKPFPHLLVLGVMLLVTATSLAQEKPTAIKLRVFHEEKEILAPDQITFVFNKQSMSVPVRNGEFQVPDNLANAKGKIKFSVDLYRDHIEFPLNSVDLSMDFWDLYVAEKRYHETVQSMVPIRANVPKSCIMSFDGNGVSAGYRGFNPHCRSKKK